MAAAPASLNCHEDTCDDDAVVNLVSSHVDTANVLSHKRVRGPPSPPGLCAPSSSTRPVVVSPQQAPRKAPMPIDPNVPLVAKQYRSWTHATDIPFHAEINLLTDQQLGKVLTHHHFTMDLPELYYKNNTTGQTHEVTVMPILQWTTKTFTYLTCKILAPSQFVSDTKSGEIDIPIRQGDSPLTSHTYTVRHFLNNKYDNPRTLADIGIDQSLDDKVTRALTATWATARASAVTRRVQAAAASTAVTRLSAPPPLPSSSVYKQILPVRPPIPTIRPFADAARNRVWMAAFTATPTTDFNLMASIDMLEPDPAHRGSALASSFRPFWLEAEKLEWDGLVERKCFKRWQVKDLLKDDRVFNARYVYKLKRDATTGLVSRFKARLIVQGFRMQKDLDYNDTFSPTPGSTASRMMISLATSQDWELHSCDFTQAFIQADRLPEGVNGRFFIRPPPGSPDYDNKSVVYEVLRPLYGVPSSPRALHKTLDGYFKSLGFTNVGFEESVWKRRADNTYKADLFVSAHVDDSLICCPSLSVLQQFKRDLLDRFQGTDEGEVTQYLGCQLIRDRPNRTSRFVQTAYTERLLRTFGAWDNTTPALTPLAPGQRLVAADCPDPSHDAGLHYCDPGLGERDVLYGWVDSDFAADPDTRRSMTGYVMALNGAPISWKSCRQGGVTLSSSEAEYVAASAAAQENIYLRCLLAGFNRTQLSPTRVWKTTLPVSL